MIFLSFFFFDQICRLTSQNTLSACYVEKVSSNVQNSDSGSSFVGEEAQQITFTATDLVISDGRESKRDRAQEVAQDIFGRPIVYG